MEINKLKVDMKSLWKETFMDSDEYINIVFDNYFEPDNCFFMYDNDVLVSDMLCVPYNFGFNKKIYADADNNSSVMTEDEECYLDKLTHEKHISFKISYQCGLATKYDYRRMGLMSSLINKSNRELFDKGFVLSVLIPSDEEKYLYYSKFGYIGIAYLNTNNYEIIDMHHNDYLANCGKLSIRKVLEQSSDISAKIYDVHSDFNFDYKDLSLREDNNIIWLYECYSVLSDYALGCHVLHSIDDFIAVLRENYVGGGKILLMVDSCDKPLAMLFCFINEDGNVTVQLLLSKLRKCKIVLLQVLKSLIPDNATISVREYEMKNSSKDGDDYVDASLEGSQTLSTPQLSNYEKSDAASENRAKPYAMAKILHVAEILKFVAALHPNSEFSILVNNDEFDENLGFYHVKHGKLIFQKLKDFSDNDYRKVVELCRNSSDKYILSVPELATILFRQESKGDRSKPKMSELAIPRISLNVALMLD